MIRIKDQTPPISLDNVHPRIFLAIGIAGPIWEKYDSPDLWITAVNEEGHTTNPDPNKQFHHLPDGSCSAVDLRTWTIREPEHRRLACKELADTLGPNYDVIFERPGQPQEHCHVEFDPKP